MNEPKYIDYINKQLKDRFGINTVNRKPMYRVVWVDEQYREKRLSKFTPAGIELIHKEVQDLPKYYYIKDRWVLEQLVIIPDIQADELPANENQESYEPLWTFEGRNKELILPKLNACLLVIDTMLAVRGKKSLRKYVDAMKDNPIEETERRIKELENELFGDESGLEGKTIHGEGIVVPNKFQSTQKEL
jgi:hypothetical protein